MNFEEEENKNKALSDEELFLKMIDNPDLLGEIIDRYEKRLFVYIKRNSGLEDEAVEDLVQDIFLSVYQNAKSFNPDLKFSSWIYRIAHNKMVDYWKKHKKDKTQISLDENLTFIESIFNHSDVQKEAELLEQKELVEKVCSNMKPKYREILFLRYLEEKSYSEISDILKKSVGTIGTLVARAKKNFRKELEKIKK